MIAVPFPGSNFQFAANQDEYEPIAGYAHGDAERRVSFCFRLSEPELEEIARTRSLWIQVLTFGQPLQPIGLSTQRPADVPA